MTDYVNLIAAALGCLGALAGLGGFLRFRSRRDRTKDIGESFIRTANGLGSNTPIERLSAAALLPRFFGSRSEYGTRDMPYAEDAVKLAAAVLKTEPAGIIQKAIADGLAEAVSLDGVDFQRANLRNCYWGLRQNKRPVSAVGADFFRADLSSASLRGARLANAVFMSAQLVGTVLRDADLQGCNFDSANLRGARFRGANLTRATFRKASNIPPEVLARIDEQGVFMGGKLIEDGSQAGSGDRAEAGKRPKRVFLSRPSLLNRQGLIILAQITQGLRDAGVEAMTFPPDEYGVGAPLDEVKQRIGLCDGTIVLGVPQMEASKVVWYAGTTKERAGEHTSLATPWNHIEAGIASALDKPILIIRDEVAEGIFAIGDQPHAVTIIDIGDDEMMMDLGAAVASWAVGI
ncbi:MAG: pentapeptide repeat-containing protein [Treponema sp.]|jgi:hypothetical protein|nr:pentapeptide repeat-containing protein [Treponema sp.]